MRLLRFSNKGSKLKPACDSPVERFVHGAWSVKDKTALAEGMVFELEDTKRIYLSMHDIEIIVLAHSKFVGINKAIV